MPTVKQNRLTSRAPRTHHPFWCSKCDHELVRQGEKCPNCSARAGDKPATRREMP
jgi:hypothetical protein